jgi:hypothetical protein
MGRFPVLVALLSLAVAGCATPRPPAGLQMPAPDEAYAANLLAAYLLGQGWTVRLANEALVEAYRGEERLVLEPVLDAAGLDRILLSRAWPRDPQASDEALQAFALELNEVLNVGQFRVDSAGLEYQASLPFLEVLEPRLLDAFLAFTAEVRFAVQQVEGERRLLAPVEDGGDSR